jgi:hypothetical protein
LMEERLRSLANEAADPIKGSTNVGAAPRKRTD